MPASCGFGGITTIVMAYKGTYPGFAPYKARTPAMGTSKQQLPHPHDGHENSPGSYACTVRRMSGTGRSATEEKARIRTEVARKGDQARGISDINIQRT